MEERFQNLIHHIQSRRHQRRVHKEQEQLLKRGPLQPFLAFAEALRQAGEVQVFEPDYSDPDVPVLNLHLSGAPYLLCIRCLEMIPAKTDDAPPRFRIEIELMDTSQETEALCKRFEISPEPDHPTGGTTYDAPFHLIAEQIADLRD